MNNKAEKAVIGCLLMDNSLADGVKVTPEMFMDDRLKRVFTEIEKCAAQGKAFDLPILSATIPTADIENRELNKLLADCSLEAETTKRLPRYAQIVRERYKARKLTEICQTVQGDPRIVRKQITELVGQLEELNDDAVSSGVTLEKAAEWFDGDMFTPNRKAGIKLGYRGLDSKIGGLKPGHLMIIAARPSVGKSAITTEIAIRMAKAGKKVELFNLEMSVEENYQRVFAHESGLDLSKIQRATTISDGDAIMADEAKKSIAEMKDRLILCDRINKVSDMISELKQNKADVAIIDYAQLIRPESRYAGNRTAEVGAISHSVKNMARKLKIPVILLAQLNRSSVGTREPSMSELRESGDFEQDADQIILLWNKTDDRTLKGIKVDKNRHGDVGKLEMTFDGAVMQFHEVDGYEDEEDYSDSPFIGD